MYNRVMKRTAGLVSMVVVAGSLSVARADAPSPFDVRTVPAAQTPSRATAETPPAATETVVERGATQRKVALWTAVGGGVLIGGSLAFAAFESSRWHDAVARDDVDAATDAQNAARNYGTALFVGGVAALGVATVLYFTAPRMRERNVIVAPAAGPDNLGLAISGGF
jgi:hypothetical protein